MQQQRAKSARADVYQRITAEIAAAIEAGAGSYSMPWHHDGTSIARPANFASGRRYRGINALALWASAEARGYRDGLWGTYRQWAAAGAQVRKGEKAATVVLWKEIRQENDQSDGADGDDDTSIRRMVARAFSVFNAAQVDGYAPPVLSILPEAERLAHAEIFIANLGVKTEFGGDQAYYRPSADTIVMPSFASFREAAGFYGVWAHEAAHASGAKHRLDRDLSGRFGSAAYAFEELVAEFASAMVLADLAIACHPRADHAAYLASWLGLLKTDSSALFTAASKAQQAADWMHRQQPAAAV